MTKQEWNASFSSLPSLNKRLTGALYYNLYGLSFEMGYPTGELDILMRAQGLLCIIFHSLLFYHIWLASHKL